MAASSQPTKTEKTEEFHATHGNITVVKMQHSDEKIPTDTKEGLELEVQSPYLDKTALDTKIGLTSQNVKHDSYF